MNQNINYSNLDPSYLRNLIINTYDKKDKQNLLEKEEVKKVFLKEQNSVDPQKYKKYWRSTLHLYCCKSTSQRALKKYLPWEGS